MTAIYWPMGAMALVTFAVLGLIPKRRLEGVRRKEITAENFRLGESRNVSDHIAIPNRAMMNLLELPMLFYVICLMAIVSGGATWLMVVLAWIYVVLRVIHSAIHLTYNNVTHRLIPFASSNFVLILMWISFFAGIAVR